MIFFRSTAILQCVDVSPDGRRTIWTGKRGVRGVLDGKQVGEFYAANGIQFKDYGLTPDRKHVVHDAYQGELQLGNLWTGQMVREFLPRSVREKAIVSRSPPTTAQWLWFTTFAETDENTQKFKLSSGIYKRAAKWEVSNRLELYSCRCNSLRTVAN